MIYAGVDIAKASHVIGAVDDSGEEVAPSMSFGNDGEGFERCDMWLEGLAERQDDVVIAMEATGSYWMALFTHLAAAGYSAVVVNPVHVKAVRKLKDQMGVKTDRIDSLLIAETLRLGGYDATRMATDELLSLKTLTRYRQSLQGQLAQTKTKVVSLMDAYFPEYPGLFGDIFCASSLALLSRSPLPAKIARMKAPALERLLSEASRGRLGRPKADEVRSAARASVGVRLGEEAASIEIKGYIEVVGFLREKVAEADRQIGALLARVEPLVLTIPGISGTLGAQIVAEIGDVARFKNAASIVKYAGLNPGVNESGQFAGRGIPITKAGSPHLRRAMWLAAERAYRFDPGLGEFYAKKRAEGKCHRVAVTAVARKLCHIVYAVMRDQRPFDPDRQTIKKPRKGLDSI